MKVATIVARPIADLKVKFQELFFFKLKPLGWEF
jgi:hypothetical protein